MKLVDLVMSQALVCSYSRAIAGWLTNKFPGAVSLHSSTAGNEEIISVFQMLLPAIEFYATTQENLDLSGRIKQLSGFASKNKQLSWMLDVFSNSDLPETVKDELYSQLKVFVKWKQAAVDEIKINLPVSIARPGKEIKFNRSRHTHHVTRKKIHLPVELKAEEKLSLLDVMKLSLAMNYRETDPVSFGEARDIEFFDMGGGISIALVGLPVGKRLSLESYIGYMAFKNNLPIAYGGGWIWGQRCRIGISIYPEYRKGESARLFSEILRLYYQHFNARHFIIRPNQFGKDNRDGLKSGAFWFYYKLGFRPGLSGLKKLAGEEWKKIRAGKNYRSSLETLKLFTAGTLEWFPGKTGFEFADAETISRKLTDMINKKYGSSRRDALSSITSQVKQKLRPLQWPKETKLNRVNFENWCLLINMFPGFRSWKQKEKKQLIELIRVKQEGVERDYITGLQKFTLFWKSLNKAQEI